MSITRQQALDCFASDDLIGIGMEADALRRNLHPEGVVSYTIERTIDCSFDQNLDPLFHQIDKATEAGATTLRLRNSDPDATQITHHESTIASIKKRYPNLAISGQNANEIIALATRSNITLHDCLIRLRDAGIDDISGDTSHTTDWLNLHKTAHNLKIRTTATMIFGLGETTEQRIHHLETIYNLQQETAGFKAFIPIASPALGLEEPTAVEYLKTLAISRLYLDSVPNIQTSGEEQGLKVLQMALRFGSNDAGSITIAPRAHSSEEDLRRIIRGAGFRPVQRDNSYRTMFLN
jgi:cyclic dehypoxanthinyl futalosine synthase